MLTILQWIAAHLFADFVLQSKKLIQQKKERKAGSWFLYAHSLIHASLIYFFSPDKSLWIIPVIVFVTHYFIDLWKVYQKESAVIFIADQLMHVTVLVVLWVICYENVDWPAVIVTRILINNNFWVIITAYLFVIYPLAYLLGYATQRWRKDIEHNERSSTSLSEAGKWIGVFERILVLTFVINNHFEGIGFLIAAKSILRFNDIKGNNMRKEAEYILIGTLMSFASSIIIGICVRLLMK
jgi:uncharacterized protein DUF3307